MSKSLEVKDHDQQSPRHHFLGLVQAGREKLNGSLTKFVKSIWNRELDLGKKFIGALHAGRVRDPQ